MAFGNLLGCHVCQIQNPFQLNTLNTPVLVNLEHPEYPYIGSFFFINLTQPRVTQEKGASAEKLSRSNLPMAMPVRDYLD